MALTGSSSPHFYLARSRSTSLPPVAAKSSPSHLASGGNGTSFPFSSSPSSVSWPSSMLPCLALAFDDPSFFADLRIDINPLTTSSTTSSTTLSSCASSSSSMSTQNGGKESSRPSSRTSSGEGPEDLGVGGDVGRTSSSLPSSAASSSSSVVWVHRMVLAVHSPVFRSLLRDTGGSREAREGVIDMRGPEHPPGAVVRCMLKMMYASPGLAIDELGKEPKLSDEWEFLLQLFKLAHLYQVEVVLDACTRRIKHILERKDLGGGVHAVGGTRMRRRRSSSAKSPSTTATGNNNSLKDVEEDLLLAEEEEERMRQTCYALELLAFLLHVKEAETRSSSSTVGDLVDENDNNNNDSSNDVDLRRVHKNWKKAAEEEPLVVVGVAGVDAKSPTMPPRSGEAGTAGEDMDQQHQQQVGLSERREEMLVRLLDQHLYPQLLTIVQHIRCEDVLTLQHLLQLSVCRPITTTSPVSPPPAWPGGPGARTSHVKQQHLHGGSS